MLHRPTQQETFQALLDDFSARVQQAFLAAIANIRSRVTLSLVITRLERHDTEGAIRALGIEGSVFNPMLDEIDAAYAAGGGGANSELPTIRNADGFPITVTFDQRNPAAEAWLKQNGVTLVRQITDDQVTMLRRVIGEDVGQGMNSRQIALDLVGRINRATGQRAGGLIGLTDTQAQWAQNYRAELENLDANALTRSLRDRRFDKTVRKAIDTRTKMSADQTDAMVNAYRNRSLLFRGEAIGRSESHTALNAGRDEAMRQAIASGDVSASLVEETWNGVDDGRERASHVFMNGQTVPWGQSFVSGLGNRLRFPGDPSAPIEDTAGCRCNKTFRIRKAS